MTDHGIGMILNWIAAHGWRLFWALLFIAGAGSGSISVRKD
jgi:hypothetical protein